MLDFILLLWSSARKVVENPPGGIKVGIVWASNPDNKAMYERKSFPLELIMPFLADLMDLTSFTFILCSLETMQSSCLVHDHPCVFDWKDTLKDFSETAHVVNQLDLLISVDTAVAHLAGALNKPTWLLLLLTLISVVRIVLTHHGTIMSRLFR